MHCSNPDPDPTDPDTGLPPVVAERLAAHARARWAVPPEVDAAILRQARQYLPAMPQPRENRRPVSVGRKLRDWLRDWVEAPGLLPLGQVRIGVAVSALVLAVGLTLWWVSDSGPGPAFAGDLNRDGEVNILDAFTLALAAEAGHRPDADLDLNHDGRVDLQDVAVLAARAVALGKEGPL